MRRRREGDPQLDYDEFTDGYMSDKDVRLAKWRDKKEKQALIHDGRKKWRRYALPGAEPPTP